MKIKKRFQYFLNQHGKKEIFLLGFYISFFVVMVLASMIDFIIGNDIDAYIEIFYIILTVISFIYYQYSKNMTVAVYGIVILATFATYSLLISNSFNISVFHIIMPLGYFLLFSLKRAFFYTFMHQNIVVAIYIYGYLHYPDNTQLHDPSILAAIVMASLVIVFFGIVYHVSVENSYRQLDRSNQQKELLLQEVHHRIKNNLNIISSILGLQRIGENNDEIKHLLQKNQLRINSIAMVHEQLYKHNNFETINVYEYLSDLVKMIVDIYDCDVKVCINKEDIRIPFEDILKLGIITNELVINSIKHAFECKDGEIDILFIKKADEYYYEYRDNGEKPIDIDQIKNSSSLGLKLVTMMVKQMEATIVIENDIRLIYKLRIPIEPTN